jgi:hypothetical protein
MSSSFASRFQPLKSTFALFAIASFVIASTSIGFAAGASAMLQAKGMVTVNGEHVPGSIAIFENDRVVTGEKAAATITRAGLMVVVPANTELVYHEKLIELRKKGALVSTSDGTRAQLGKVSVAPTSNKLTKFELGATSGGMLVSSLVGALSILDGGSTTLLPAGQSLTLGAATATAVPQMNAAIKDATQQVSTSPPNKPCPHSPTKPGNCGRP